MLIWSLLRIPRVLYNRGFRTGRVRYIRDGRSTAGNGDRTGSPSGQSVENGEIRALIFDLLLGSPAKTCTVSYAANSNA